jgi:methylated-DNA-[protein]-cysteine S-methyltransferase
MTTTTGPNPTTDATRPARSSTPWHTVAPTTLGDLTIVRDDEAILGLYFPHHWGRPDLTRYGPPGDDGFDEVTDHLAEYLAGQRRTFTVPGRADGDPWQHRVWELIARVPYGGTTTYGELAAALGGDLDARQVGSAVGRNPLSILVPCHRVVGRGGKLTGYAGGLARKRQLLELEGCPLPFELALGLEAGPPSGPRSTSAASDPIDTASPKGSCA